MHGFLEGESTLTLCNFKLINMPKFLIEKAEFHNGRAILIRIQGKLLSKSQKLNHLNR